MSAATTDIVASLRAATRCAHERIEAHPILRPVVTGQGFDHEAYCRILRAFLTYYGPLERQLDERVPRAHGYRYRARAPLLEQDLRDLCDAPVGAARTPTLPRFDDPTERVLGVLYVIEGAARGGRHVIPLLARALDVSAQRASRFFRLGTGSGEAFWQAFCMLLRKHGACASRQVMVESALETFDTLYAHLDECAGDSSSGPPQPAARWNHDWHGDGQNGKPH